MIMTMAASGWTWHDKFVLQDLETGSLWWTGPGTEGLDTMLCIAGPLQDRLTLRLESFRAPWHVWVEHYPQTLFLKLK